MINETLKSLAIADLGQRYNDTIIKYAGKVRYVLGFEPSGKGVQIILDTTVDDGKEVEEAPEAPKAPHADLAEAAQALNLDEVQPLPVWRQAIDWNVIPPELQQQPPPPPRPRPVAFGGGGGGVGVQAQAAALNDEIVEMQMQRVILNQQNAALAARRLADDALALLQPNPQIVLPVVTYTDPAEDPAWLQFLNRTFPHREHPATSQRERTRRQQIYADILRAQRNILNDRVQIVLREIDRLTGRIGRTLGQQRQELTERRAAFRVERDKIRQWMHEYPVFEPQNAGLAGLVRGEVEPLLRKKVLQKNHELVLFDYKLLDTERPSSRWYINKQGKPVYLYYSMARQYQRGHNQRNTHVTNQNHGWKNSTESWNQFRRGLEAAYSQNTIIPNVRVGIGELGMMLKNRKHLILSPSLLISDKDIYYRLTKIGEFKSKQDVQLKRPEFSHELQERITGIKLIGE